MTRGGGGKTLGLGGIGGVAAGAGGVIGTDAAAEGGEKLGDGEGSDAGGFGIIVGGGGGRTAGVEEAAGGDGNLLRGGGGMGGITRFGVSIAGAGAPPFDGVRAGKLIRTVSRESPAGAPTFVPARGGKVIRTVSFFGSFRSLMTGFVTGRQNC